MTPEASTEKKATARETLLNATGGVSGTFSTLRAAPNVFLDASLSYDPNNVFLNINRINVAKATILALSQLKDVKAEIARRKGPAAVEAA